MVSEVTLHLGDCLEYMRGMEAGSADAVITDPPYGVGVKYSGLFEDTPEYVRSFLPVLISEGERISKVVLFPSGKYENELWIMQNYPPRWRMCLIIS